MRDRPTGDELLELARGILRGDLLAHLPAEKKYDALMVANAMAIAARQMRAGDGPARQELAALARLYGEDPVATTPEEVADHCRRLYTRLAADVRAGHFDPGTPGHDVALALVRAHVTQKVRESNPKYLERA